MPQNKLQEFVFTTIMAMFMVYGMIYGMICYNVALSTGGFTKCWYIYPDMGNESPCCTALAALLLRTTCEIDI